MTAPCNQRLPEEELLAYWLGEMVPLQEQRTEEHLFSCAGCSTALQGLVALLGGVRESARRGGAFAIVSASHVERLREAGLIVREYRVGVGGSVACTVAPQDDIVIANLEAALPPEGGRLDLVVDDLPSGASARMADIAFDPAASAVVVASKVSALRALDTTVQRMRLLHVEDGRERIVGEYTFNHSRWLGTPQALK